MQQIANPPRADYRVMMSGLEIVAFVLGVINVTLVVRRSLWNYPFGLAMVTLYAKIFYDTKLYSDALLQIFFFVVQIYGWIEWRRSENVTGEVAVTRLTPTARIAWLVLIAIGTAGWGAFMHRHTDAAYPWWDGSIAIMSVVAQMLMARRYIENWVLWIALDVSAVALYAVKGLSLTAVLYVIFLALSVWGLIDWHRAEVKQHG